MSQMTVNENTQCERFLLRLDSLNGKLRRCFGNQFRETAEQTGQQVWSLITRLKGISYSPIVLDSCNLLAKLALYRHDFGEMAIHLSFVGDVCRGEHELTTQYADCLELTAYWALEARDGDAMAGALKWCRDIRMKVLGPYHPDTVRAIGQWERFQQVMEAPEPKTTPELVN